MITNIENTKNNDDKIEIIDGLFIYEDYLDHYDKFDDFKFIDIDDEYIYYYNKFRNNEIYKIKINNDYIFISEDEYRVFPEIIFSEKYNFEPYYFASGEFDSLNNYDFNIPESNIIINENDTVYSIYTNNGEIINNTKGYVYDYSDGYFYFRNLEDNRTIYRIKKDSTGLQKVVNIPYLYIHLIDENYLYYRNYDDDTKMYRVKKDGTEVNGGNLFVNIRNAIPLFENGDYIYYQDTYNGARINRIKKDGSQLSSGGEKVIDISGTGYFNDGDYIYYRNSNDSYNLYKANISGIDFNGGLKIFNFNTSLYYYFDKIFNDEENIYFYGGDTSDSGIYRIAKNGSDLNKSLRKIKNGSTGIDKLLVNGDYIYYRNYEDNYKIYRVKKDQTQLFTGGSSISSLTNNYLLFIDSNELYYKNNLNGFLYKVDLNTIDNSNYGTQLNSVFSSEVINVENDQYIYYTNNNYLYRVEKNQTIIIPPTNLKQQYLPPESDLDLQDIEPYEKLGKYQAGYGQSGLGVQLSAYINNPDKLNLKLEFELFDRYGITPKYIQTMSEYNNASFFTGTVILDYPGAGNYYWRVRTIDDNGNTSEWSDFGLSAVDEVDFGLFEGFEPYPFGYSFPNSSPAEGTLSGGINYYFNPIDFNIYRTKIDGNKWEIFNTLTPESNFSSTEEMYDVFETIGLNEENSSIFKYGNCLGLSLSALDYKYYPEDFTRGFLGVFRDTVGPGTIWQDTPELSTNSDGEWNDGNSFILKTISMFQLILRTQYYIDANKNSLNNLSATGVLNELKDNPQGKYILSFVGGKNEKDATVGHVVVPYRVEGNRIYIWDNNIPFPNKKTKSGLYYGYKQYIEINSDGTFYSDFYHKEYGWNYFVKLALIDIDDLFKKDSNYIGFNDTDTLYGISGYSDLILEDSMGRISGFSGSTIIEEIPGVDVIIPLNTTLSGAVENTWKQIYLPQKQDNLTIQVIAKETESYNLMIAGGDYYTKIEGVETSSGQIDIFKSSRENFQIDFDDNKVGDYNLLTDNFHNNGTGTVYMDSVEAKIEPQQYVMSWTGVINNANDAVIYEIDTDDDGIYDESISLPPVYSDVEAPITTYSFSGELDSSSTGSTYIETVTMELNAIDNEGGSGVNDIYYAIGTDTGALVYTTYTGPIIINGVGEYTLNFYARDVFGNVEETQIQNFSLIERPETNSGNISGYVFSDDNSPSEIF